MVAPRRGIRSPGAAHSAPGCRRTVRGGDGEEWNGQGEHALAAGPVAGTAPPDAGPVAGTHRSLRPVVRYRPAPHSQLGPGPRSRFPHFSQRPELNGEPLPTVQNHLVPPVSICGCRRTGYGSIVTAWSRGTAISLGTGTAGMLWHGGRTTGQAGPV